MSAIRVPLFDVCLTQTEQEAVAAPLKDGWLTMGRRVTEFEQAFARASGSAHAIAVNSGTAALHLSLQVLGIGPGDQVICPALTFVATANAVRYVGAEPVLCDIVGDHDLNLDPEHVERLITPRTRAVLAVHYAGYPADLPALQQICRRHGLHFIEDAAHACLSTLQGQTCGTWGDLGCFSFYSNKNITCGEGGAILTDDTGLAAELRLLRSHAMTTSAVERHRGLANSYDVVDLGHNYRLDELRGSLIHAQLQRLDGFLDARRRHVDRYRQQLESLPVTVPHFNWAQRSAPGDRIGHHIFPILLPFHTRRSEVMDAMRRQGVQTSIHYPPLHRLTAFQDTKPVAPLPQCDALAHRQLTLPLFPTLTQEQQDWVVESLKLALEEASRESPAMQPVRIDGAEKASVPPCP